MKYSQTQKEIKFILKMSNNINFFSVTSPIMLDMTTSHSHHGSDIENIHAPFGVITLRYFFVISRIFFLI